MELSLELSLNQHTRTATKAVNSLTLNVLNAFITETAIDGWIVKSWAVNETLPFDEGFNEAKAGKSIETNPYSETHWKNKEWWMGWHSFYEGKS